MHFADVADSEVLEVRRNANRKRGARNSGRVLFLYMAWLESNPSDDMTNKAPATEHGRYKREVRG
jgi:hypothetical protein